MKKIIPFLILITSTVYSQTEPFNFHSPENIKKFADHLFCEGDYLRAAEEYEKIRTISDDTINFKIMISYSEIGLYQQSNLKYKFQPNSLLTNDARRLFIKNLFLDSPDSYYEKTGSELFPFQLDSLSLNYRNKLISISFLFSSVDNIPAEEILYPFELQERKIILSFYDQKKDPSYKSPLLAGVFSTIVPGTGLL